MRQKIWGILLFEKPRNDEMAYGVWELAVSGPESLENYVFNPALSPRGENFDLPMVKQAF